MAELRAGVSFPGIKQVSSYTGTLNIGTSPGVHRLDIAPQFGVPKQNGDLVLTFGRNKIALRNCRIDSASYTRNASGAVVSLVVFDRRWKWAFGRISGSYNVRDDAGAIVQPAKGKPDAIDDSERTPQQLAKLCLEAMGEKNFAVADLPNDTRPSVTWDNANPAQALYQLCSSLACVVVLGLDDSVAIRKIGKGKGGRKSVLPAGPLTPDTSESLDTAEQPDATIVVTAPAQFQVDLLLEAVGIETDGTIKPIDDLSYKPAGGWSDADIPGFAAVAEANRKSACDTVYKWYRVVSPCKAITKDVRRIEQILPLIAEQVEKDAAGKPKPAEVFGVFFNETTDELDNTAEKLAPLTADNQVIRAEGWTLDATRGLVVFSRPIYKHVGDFPDNTHEAADLVLRCSVNWKQPEDRALQRAERRRDVKKKQRVNTPPFVLVQDDIVPTFYATYNPAEYFRNGDATKLGIKQLFANAAEIDKSTKHYLDAAEAKFATQDSQSAVYAGWLAIECDGAIQSVTWSLSEGGAFTNAERNRDFGSPVALPFKERQEIERRREAARQAAKERPEVRRKDNERIKVL